MLALGASDSGFESRRPDINAYHSMHKGFIKNKEDFTCQNCGFFVQGTGYTNHCHQCFYSKHVDIQPGDRAEQCQGMMKPAQISGSTRNIVIEHTCQSCGFVRKNKLQEGDDTLKLVELMKQLNTTKR